MVRPTIRTYGTWCASTKEGTYRINHGQDVPAYGLWLLVIVNAAIFILFAFEQQEGTLATTGAYAHVRDPQYFAFILIMFGFLLQWPTLVTLVMFPVLVTVYVKLAHREERDVRAQFGSMWDADAARTPAFVPTLWGRHGTGGSERHAPA